MVDVLVHVVYCIILYRWLIKSKSVVAVISYTRTQVNGGGDWHGGNWHGGSYQMTTWAEFFLLC